MAEKTVIHKAKNIPDVNPDQAIQIICQAYELRQAVMFWGAPGGGKSASARGARKALEAKYGEKVGLKEVYLSRMTPADVGGLPALDAEKKKTTFYLPDLLTDLGGLDRGIIFFDEITTADPQTRAAVLNLILEGKLGDFELPSGWFCIGAANPKEYGGIYGDLGAAMNNRFMHFTVAPEFKQWADKWAPNNNVSPVVLAFLRNGNVEHFYAGPEELKSNPKAFTTPRNWVQAGEIIERTADEKLRNLMLQGRLGNEAAMKFAGWYRECSGMRDMETYLEASDSEEKIAKMLPRKTAPLYLIACSMKSYVTNEDPVTSERAFAVLNAIFFANDRKFSGIDSFNDLPVREIAVVGWEMAGTKALDIKYPGAKSRHFLLYNSARERHLGAIKN